MYNERKDLDNTAFEEVWPEILLSKSKLILVGICYRSPDQSYFYDSLKEILIASNYNLGQELTILDDLNTNMQKNDTSLFKHFH